MSCWNGDLPTASPAKYSDKVLNPCRNRHCECPTDGCTHPGYYDARGAQAPTETIVAAAIRIPVADEWKTQMWQGNRVYPDYLTITAPAPARHGTLMHPLSDHGLRAGPDHQGFVTSTGRYVERSEALRIVLNSGQPARSDRADLLQAVDLYSEDLW